MQILGQMLSWLTLAVVALYSGNYAVWAWRRRLRLGAVGLAVLTISAVALPVWLMMGR